MRKFLTAGVIMAAAVLALSGCGGSGEKTEETKAETQAEAETGEAPDTTDEASITLGNYKGLKAVSVKSEVTDEELDQQIAYILNMYPEPVTGRPAEMGDTVIIDYKGMKDGVAFDGGTAEGASLNLGSHQFIDGFEEGVVGMEIGDEKDLNLKFPEEYHAEDLAGQEVVFHVTLHEINTPKAAMDDDLAKKVLNDDNATTESLKEDLRSNMLKQKERDAFYQLGNELLNQVIEASEITCDPDAVDEMHEKMVNTYTFYAGQLGMDLDTYLSMAFQTDVEGFRSVAEQMVKQQMVLYEIIEKEGLTATDEQKQTLAESQGFETVEDMVAAMGEESTDELFGFEAAYSFLIDNGEITEE